MRAFHHSEHRNTNAPCALRFPLCRSAALRLALVAALLASALLAPAARASSLAIYADALASGWNNGSWADVSLDATSPVHSGAKSASVTVRAGYEGFQVCHLGFSTAGYTQLRFWINGGTAGGQRLLVYATRVGDTADHLLIKQVVAQPGANTWREVQIPLAEIEADNRTIRCIVVQDASGAAQPTFFLDDLRLSADDAPDGPVISEVSVLPAALPKDGSTAATLRVKVSDPQGLADIATVTVDASGLGRGTVTLRDDGHSGDYGPDDGWFGAAVSAADSATLGEHNLVAHAVDHAGQSDYAALGALVVLRSAGGAIPAALPQRLGYGTTKLPGTDTFDWQGQTGVPWDYSYFYITADNPSSPDNESWESWDTAYVTKMATQAWAKNYIPVVSVYLMLYTPPSTGEGGSPYATKLQNASTVSAYLASLRKAAQQAKGSKPIIFHIEPDLYGFMQQYSNDPNRPSSVRANDPSSIPVALNQPGYNNTFADFGRYIVAMVKAEAPNALVAMHASMYATNREPWQGTPSEAENIAALTSDFINKAGGTESDLYFVEWSDRDAGYQGQPDSRLWWDDTNRAMPHINRVLLWENKLSEVAGKRLVLWQVPCGNTTLDNQPTRYQDNRAAYIFRHPRDLYDSGVVAVLFGGGTASMTMPNVDSFIATQSATAYAPPPAPEALSAVVVAGNGVHLRWNDIPAPDLWFYRVFAARGSSAPLTYDVSRANAAMISLVGGGTWRIWVRAYDAQGNEGATSATTLVDTTGAPLYQVFLPLIRR